MTEHPALRGFTHTPRQGKPRILPPTSHSPLQDAQLAEKRAGGAAEDAEDQYEEDEEEEEGEGEGGGRAGARRVEEAEEEGEEEE